MNLWASIVKGVIGDGIGNNVVAYLSKKAELKAAAARQKLEMEEAVHQRKVDLIKQGLTADMSWEQTFADQAASTWKDEYSLIIVSIPAVLAFVPGFDVYVANGFRALSDTPAWYQLVLISLFLATVGIRYWRRGQSDT